MNILNILLQAQAPARAGIRIGMQDILLVLLIAITFYFLFIRPNKKRIEQEKIKKEQGKQIIIPDTCPHCKNPNTKKLQVCEWCGNEIY